MKDLAVCTFTVTPTEGTRPCIEWEAHWGEIPDSLWRWLVDSGSIEPGAPIKLRIVASVEVLDHDSPKDVESVIRVAAR